MNNPIVSSSIFIGLMKHRSEKLLVLCLIEGMDRILSGYAPVSKTSIALCPDPSSIELPEGNQFTV